MTIYLYNTASEPNRLTKQTTLVASATGSIRDTGSVDVVNPEILVSGSISGANYAYIPDFARYYYITESTIVRSGLTMVSMKCDPLMSFSSAIKSLPCIAVRTENRKKQTPYIFDAKRPYMCYQLYRTFLVHTFSGSTNVILVTAG